MKLQRDIAQDYTDIVYGQSLRGNTHIFCHR